MPDTSPEALDALIAGLHDAARSIEFDSDRNLMTAAADTIAAMRAAPVAMRERAAGEADKRAHDGMRPANGWTDNQAEWWQIGTTDAALAIRDAIRALPLDAPAPAWDRVAQGVFHEVPAPVDPVQVFRDRDGNVVGRSWKPSTPDPVAEAARTVWNAYGPSRDDAPPTLAEAMTVPEVRALVEALETLHVAATLMADRCGLRDCDEALDESSAILAKLKGGTP
jgi:hypothetical protein